MEANQAIPNALVSGCEDLIDGLTLPNSDEFIDDLFDLDQAAVVAAAQKQRSTLKSPPIDVDRYLDILMKQGLTKTVKDLSAYRTVL